MDMTQLTKIRRNIHTYPFKYSQLPAEEFFTPQPGVLYIHIPFCSTKCHFCDYTVYINKPLDQRARYVDALCKEIAMFPENPAFPQFRIEAIYIGGGTPGLLSAAQLLQILQACRDNYLLMDGCEVCAEFDPACVDLEKLQALKEGGYTRVSVGVQSFNDNILKQSNRPHDLDSVYTAFECIDKSGFEHVNIDLIYPLPGLTQEIWEDSVQRAIALKPGCITAYGLEVWPGTAYYNWLERGKLTLPDPAAEVAMFTYAVEALENAGFRPRSTSGYYHPDRAPAYCRFLDFYWRTWPMIGFGVSSKSVVNNLLWTNIKPLGEYVQRIEAGQSPMDFATRMSKTQEMRRVMIRGLKMLEVGKRDFYERFGVEMEVPFKHEIESLVADGLLKNEETRVALTRKGQIYSTNVYERFYTEDDLRPPTAGEVQFGISALVGASN
jgi:putative oxygen-independent coproporphyrinogen III oxidase